MNANSTDTGAKPRYRGAIFDQDGLLFDTEKVYQTAWVEAAKLQGVDIDAAIPRRFSGVGLKIIAEMSAAAYPALDVPRFCKTATSLAWNRQLDTTPEKKPGLMEMLQFCRSRGIKTAVASSSIRKVVEHNLSAAGVREYFDAITTGEEVEHSKPAPDIFLLAARKLGLPPQDCCVFEDAISGIKGARAAGMGAVMLPDIVEPTDDIRAICRVRQTLSDAIDILAAT